MKKSFDTISLFVLAIVFFSIIVIFYHDTIPEAVYSMIYIFPIVAASLMSFILAKKYQRIPNFCVGHIFLGISMLAYVFAEITWIIIVGVEESPYPSIVDIFYIIYAIFAILHPIAILKFFGIKPKKSHYLLFVAIIAVSLLLYCWFSTGAENEESYLFGFVFVGLSSILLGSTVLTILSIRGRQIFRVWIIIGVAFLVNSITDIPYYIMENFGNWDIGYWGNITWFISQILLVYALLEHRNKYRVLQE